MIYNYIICIDYLCEFCFFELNKFNVLIINLVGDIY